ncbi:exopolysaccharide methanolan synthase [Herbaspirillum frisingense GSF30]|uniref:Exopolysaccharide methanolan synthase n=1 Tax=Herbaspirillum frisingense GSF30 TaxID=864073 RepID=A0AAI9IC06_9BURK|nr:exosortase B [Herbaspirillum frisingense]EOA03329.1 exopolysaccharide methanolan synthase [Herbaspirillum frisingense GSF30]
MTAETVRPMPEPRFSGLPWLVIAAGLAAMYIPSFIDLFHGVWGTERNAHGPIVLAVACCYLVVRVRQLLQEGLIERRPAPIPGMAFLLIGILSFVLGRSQTVLFLEAGSLIPILMGIVLLQFGVRTCRRLWFAFFFMLFMVPLPASVVDLLTQPLKIGVSYVSEQVLRLLGYPIARSGVILYIGPYQLLVADACAGLNSLFTLEALGLLYMNLVRHQSLLRNVLLAVLIVPISFTANTVRVMVLALITYYLGDAAGQGFLHGFAGMLLFLVALGLIIALDGLLRWIAARHANWKGRAAPMPVQRERVDTSQAVRDKFVMNIRLAVPVAIVMAVSVAVAGLLVPHEMQTVKAAKLSAVVPTQFGDWREMPSPFLQVDVGLDDGTGRNSDQPYDDVLSRTYVNSHGQMVMLALAYANEQTQDVKIHLPEVCYVAQGFKLRDEQRVEMPMRGQDHPIAASRFVATQKNRVEAVSYWVRIGDGFPNGGLAARWKIFKDGMAGRVSDGILVRASSLMAEKDDEADAFALQQKFLQDLDAAVRVGQPGLLVPV